MSLVLPVLFMLLLLLMSQHCSTHLICISEPAALTTIDTVSTPVSRYRASQMTSFKLDLMFNGSIDHRFSCFKLQNLGGLCTSPTYQASMRGSGLTNFGCSYMQDVYAGCLQSSFFNYHVAVHLDCP